MNYGTQAFQGVVKVSPRFYVGWNKAKVEDVTIVTAKNGSGKKQLKFRVYGEPITTENFKPFLKEDRTTPYHGQSSIVQTVYFDDQNPEAFGRVMTRVIIPLIKALGVQEEVNTATANTTTLEGFVDALKPLITNENLPYVWMNFSGQEYEKPGSPYPGYTLSFRSVTNSDEVKEKLEAGVMQKLTTSTSSTSTSEDVVF